MDLVDERVADPIDLDAVIAVEVDLEGEDAEAADETAADEVDAARAPGPELRADEVHVAYALAFEGAREVQMEAGEVSEDGELGFAAARLG